jgi:hypothetical protein
MTLPNRLYAGDSVEFGINVADYLPADGWTLVQRLVPRFASPAQSPIALTATANGTVDGTVYDYVITATPVTTAAWVAGAYGWHTYVTRSGARQVLEGTQYSGELTVLPDPATLAQGSDTRSSARKAYDDALAARAAMASGGNAGVAEYQIGERRMKFKNPAELEQMIGQLAIEVAREKRAQAIAQGLPDPRKVYVRAVRG